MCRDLTRIKASKRRNKKVRVTGGVIERVVRTGKVSVKVCAGSFRGRCVSLASVTGCEGSGSPEFIVRG